jgi:hypothetical protein
MSEDNQIHVPESFVDLFRSPTARGVGRLRERPPVIAERYELCEDLAQALVDQARDRLFQLGIAESDVLTRMKQGLVSGGIVSGDEAWWVTHRLAELLDWPWSDERIGEPDR